MERESLHREDSPRRKQLAACVSTLTIRSPRVELDCSTQRWLTGFDSWIADPGDGLPAILGMCRVVPTSTGF
jgi:hypothetical protein